MADGGYSELDAWKERLKQAEDKEKLEILKDKVIAKERDNKYRNLKKGWENLKGLFKK